MAFKIHNMLMVSMRIFHASRRHQNVFLFFKMVKKEIRLLLHICQLELVFLYFFPKFIT